MTEVRDRAEIIIIAAMSANRVIGKNNAIPWKLPAEMRRFKKTTMGYPVIMGRKTYESIGKPLVGRKNIVVSRDRSYSAAGCQVVDTLEKAIQICAGEKKIFIIGGAQIYTQAMPLATRIILTVIDRTVAGDVLFPVIPSDIYNLVHVDENRSEGYTVYTYDRMAQI